MVLGPLNLSWRGFVLQLGPVYVFAVSSRPFCNSLEIMWSARIASEAVAVTRTSLWQSVIHCSRGRLFDKKPSAAHLAALAA